MTNETTFITVNQTDTKSYVGEKITLVYTRNFTGHPSPATMTSDMTITIPNQTDVPISISAKSGVVRIVRYLTISCRHVTTLVTRTQGRPVK